MSRKLAIITGATSGLGLCYAQTLAQMNWDLVLTGRREVRLKQIKAELESRFNIDVGVVKADFNREDQFEELLSKIDSLPYVNMLVNNAGFGCRAGFFEDSYETQQRMINVSVNACTQLVHKVVPKMIGVDEASIVNVSSLSAFVPAPLNFVYCASKSYLVEFSECLHVGLKGTGIKVQALCPGFVKTDFHARMGLSGEHSWWEDKMLWMSADDVVRKSLKALKTAMVICIPGYSNRVVYMLSKLLPKRFCYWLMAKQAKGIEREECYAVSV